MSTSYFFTFDIYWHVKFISYLQFDYPIKLFPEPTKSKFGAENPSNHSRFILIGRESECGVKRIDKNHYHLMYLYQF